MDPVTGLFLLIVLAVAAKKAAGAGAETMGKLYAAAHKRHADHLKTSHPHLSDQARHRIAHGQALASIAGFVPETYRATRRGWAETRSAQRKARTEHLQWAEGHRSRRKAELAALKAARAAKAQPAAQQTGQPGQTGPAGQTPPAPTGSTQPASTQPAPAPNPAPPGTQPPAAPASPGNPAGPGTPAIPPAAPTPVSPGPVNGTGNGNGANGHGNTGPNGTTPDPGGNQPAGNTPDGGTPMAPVTGEANSYEATDAIFAAFAEKAAGLVGHADQISAASVQDVNDGKEMVNAADQMAASLANAGVDSETQGDARNIGELAAQYLAAVEEAAKHTAAMSDLATALSQAAQAGRDNHVKRHGTLRDAHAAAPEGGAEKAYYVNG